MLWMGVNKAHVTEVDPIRGLIKVTLATGLEVEVGPEELLKTSPQEEEQCKKKRKERKEKEDEDKGRTTEKASEAAPPAIRIDPTSGVSDFKFFVYVTPEGTVLKIGALCFVESLTVPLIITRLFKLTINGNLFVSGICCVCEGGGGEIVSLLQNFQVTVECLFVSPCSSSQFSLSHVSNEVSRYVFCGQSRVFGCQERNFGNVQYLRDLRRHALGLRRAKLCRVAFLLIRPA